MPAKTRFDDVEYLVRASALLSAVMISGGIATSVAGLTGMVQVELFGKKGTTTSIGLGITCIGAFFFYAMCRLITKHRYHRSLATAADILDDECTMVSIRCGSWLTEVIIETQREQNAPQFENRLTFILKVLENLAQSQWRRKFTDAGSAEIDIMSAKIELACQRVAHLRLCWNTRPNIDGQNLEDIDILYTWAIGEMEGILKDFNSHSKAD